MATKKTKLCGSCKTTKPLSEFYKDRAKRDGLSHSCKVCQRGFQAKSDAKRRQLTPEQEARAALRLQEKKRCGVCKQIKAFSDFYKGRAAEGLAFDCKDCSKARSRAYQRKHADKAREACRRWRSNDLPKARRLALEARLRRQYGMTLEQYDELSIQQQGLCWICQTAKASAVDHCHTSGKVRGLLCGHCNKGLGHFRDNPDALERAAEYLRQNG